MGLVEIGGVPGSQESPFLGKSKMGRGSRCRELSPWAGILCVCVFRGFCPQLQCV